MTPLLLLCSLLASSAEGYVRPQLTKTTGTISMKINMQPILDRRNVLSSSFASAVVSATALGIPRAAFADKVVDASSIETTDKGVKFVTVKEGSCPASDFTGVLGSCRPSPGKFIIIDYTAFLPNGQVALSSSRCCSYTILNKLIMKMLIGLGVLVCRSLTPRKRKAGSPWHFSLAAGR